MTLDQLRIAISNIAKDDGDGYRVRVYLRSGHTFDGAHHAPADGLMKMDPWDDSDSPAVIAVEDIVAIKRVAY